MENEEKSLKATLAYLAERGYKTGDINSRVYDLFNELGDANRRAGMFERLYKEEVTKQAFPKTWNVDLGAPGGDVSGVMVQDEKGAILGVASSHLVSTSSKAMSRFFDMASNGTTKSAGHFQELVAKLNKVGALPIGRVVSAEQVIDAALAPYLAGWTPKEGTGVLSADFMSNDTGVLALVRKQQKEAQIAIQEAKRGNLHPISRLLNWPEIWSPMKHIIAARKILANGRVLGNQPLEDMARDAVKDVNSLARITDTLQHYGQLRSASTVQSIKDLCDEYESVWAALTTEKFQPDDRLKDIVSQLLSDAYQVPRDAADAQEIAKYLSDVYPTQNHSLPNAVRALFENYARLTEERKDIASMFTDEVESLPGCASTDTVAGLRWALAHLMNQRNEFRAEFQNAGRLETTEEPMFLELVRGRVAKDREKNPQPGGLNNRLDNQAERLNDALCNDPIGKVIKHAVKVAALAWRIAEEGDSAYNQEREIHNATPFRPWNPESEEDFAARVAINEGQTARIVEGVVNNPNHPEAALARIGKALVDAGQLDPEEATRFSECAFAVEVLLSNKQSGDTLLKKVADKLAESGWLTLPEIFDERSLLAALESLLQNDRTNVGDNTISFRKTRAELLLLTNTTDNRALVESVRDLQINRSNQANALVAINDIVSPGTGLDIQGIVRAVAEATRFRDIAFADLKERGVVTQDGNHTNATLRGGVDNLLSKLDWALAFPKQVAAFLKERGLFNEAWPSSPEQVRVAITEIVIKLREGQRKVGELIHDGPQFLFHLLSDAGVMNTYNEADLPSLEQGIRRLIDARKEASGDLKSVFEELNKRNDENQKALEALEGYDGATVAERLKSLFKLYDGTIELLGSAGYYKAGESPEEFRSALNALVSWTAFRDEVIRLSGATDADDALAAIRQQAATIADLKDRNTAQKYFIETVSGSVGNNDGTLPSIWSAVRDLSEQHEKALVHIGEVRNLIFETYPDRPLLDYPSIIATLQDLINIRMNTRETEIVLAENGQSIGTLLQRVRAVIRNSTGAVATYDEAVARLAAAVQKVKGVDLGDPSSVESIEAAILNLGWDCDRYEKQLREEYIAPKRAFADGQRVFVHYFDGCSDEYLGQKAAEVRGAKYASATFGWFYMVEFEEAGIGAYNFDYAEARLALVPEAYLLAGDRVRLRDSQDEGTIIDSFRGNSLERLAYRVRLNGSDFAWTRKPSELIPIDQVWSIFDRKGGKNRLMVLHAPDKWEAEKRAAKRLSRAGKPYVTLALIAIPGVADNAHYGGVTDTVEVRINRISGRDVNLLWSIRFPGNDVDAGNVREAIGTLVSTDRTSSGERISKMLPRLRALKNHFDTAPKYKEGDELETPRDGKSDDVIIGVVTRLVKHDFGDQRWSYWIDCGHIIGEVERFEDDLKPSFYADDQAAKSTSRKFDDGQLVSYLESTETGRQLATIHSVSDKSETDGVLYELRTLAQGSTLAGESRLRFEVDLLPEAKFAEGQRVITKRRNSDGDNFAKVLSRCYSDWSKKWEYEIEVTAHSLKTSRWEEDLEAVPAIGNLKAIQDTVQELVFSDENTQSVSATERRPDPKFKKGDEVESGMRVQVWVVSDCRWSDKRGAWLYDATAKGGSTSIGNMNEEELRPHTAAVLSRFLAASRDLRANVDKMVGSVVSIPTDIVERAKKQGAINPDWLDWVGSLRNQNHIVKSASTNSVGEILIRIDGSSFQLPFRYLS